MNKIGVLNGKPKMCMRKMVDTCVVEPVILWYFKIVLVYKLAIGTMLSSTIQFSTDSLSLLL